MLYHLGETLMPPTFTSKELRFIGAFLLGSVLYTLFLYWLYTSFEFRYSDEFLFLFIFPILFSAYFSSARTFYVVVLIVYVNCLGAIFAIGFGGQSILLHHLAIFLLLIVGSVINHAVKKRNETEQKLESERDKLLSILSHAPDRIAVTNSDYEIVFASQNVEKRYNSCVGKKCYEAFCDRSSPCCADCSVQEVIQKKHEHFYFSRPVVEKNVNGDDSEPVEKMFEFHAYPIELDGKPCVIEFARDISDRLHAEEQLKKSQQKLVEREKIYRDAIELAGGVPYFLNYEKDEYDFVGPGIKKLTGYDVNEFSRQIWDRCEKELFLLDKHKFQNTYEVVDRMLSGAETHWHANYRIETKTGEERWVSDSAIQIKNEQGKVIGSIGFMQDITQQIVEEKNRILLETAIEQAAESIVITDKSGKIIYVNPFFEQLTGYSREEAIGQNPRIFKSGRHDAEFYKQMWDTLNAGRVWTGEITNKKKNGELFEEQVTMSPVVDSNGTIINFVAVKRDVSERKVLEQRLRQSQKMEAIGSLAGGIAHDFNNILMAAMGYAELVRSQLPENGDLYQHQTQIIQASIRAKQLINQILSFSRQTEQEKHTIKLALIVKEALKLLSASIPKTIQIISKIEAVDVYILGDPTQIHQVIMNLCTNAYHAMREKGGGMMTVSLDRPMKGQNGMSTSNDNYCVLTVSDNGAGMDEQTLERVFEPYFTTKKKGDGTGLGLSVVHGIVQDHRGLIDVKSELGRGTTVSVSFPVLDIQQDPSPTEPMSLPTGNRERILVVDDEWPIVEMMKITLTQLGYQVDGFVSCHDAIGAFRNQPERYDLVITDMSMPQQSGIEVAQEIEAVRSGVPIVLCTGHVDHEQEKLIQKSNIQAVLFKPVLKKDLAETLFRCLHKPTVH